MLSFRGMRTSRRDLRSPWRVLLLGLLLTGCSGRGMIEFASLEFASIEPPPPRVQRVEFDRAYWMTDETDATLRVALEKDAPSLLGEIGHVVIQISLRLEKLPAGASRQYRLGPDELRGRIRVGAAESRLVSAGGIAAIDKLAGDRIRGVLRVITTRRVLQMLGGWGRGPRALLLGEFEALHDPGRCREIYAATEADDFGRPPFSPASRPASQRDKAQ